MSSDHVYLIIASAVLIALLSLWVWELSTRSRHNLQEQLEAARKEERIIERKAILALADQITFRRNRVSPTVEELLHRMLAGDHRKEQS